MNEHDTIEWQSVAMIDSWLDRAVGGWYMDQPLAQDWARLSKIGEELSEALEEMPAFMTAQDMRRLNEITKALGKAIQDHIGATGQNPRKGTDLQGYNKMLDEIADVVITGILAIQHFTKDAGQSHAIIQGRLTRTYMRMLESDRKEDDSI
jgi:hypothetical protein